MRNTYSNVPASVFVHNRLIHTKAYKRLMERARKAMKAGGAVEMETSINPSLDAELRELRRHGGQVVYERMTITIDTDPESAP